MDQGLRLAIKVAGTKTELARVTGVSRQAVSKWKKVPVCHVKRLAGVYDIPLSKLRPDLWE